MGQGYYDRKGKPIGLREWGRLKADDHYSTVAKTQVDEKVEVSTVWLGLDHGWANSSVPIIFETMVFGGPNNYYQRRYATLLEAIEGHEETLKRLKEGTLEDDEE